MSFPQQGFGNGPEPLSMSSPEVIDLFHTLQDATRLVEGGASRLGLVDLVTVGQESAGKSSVLGAVSGLQLPTGGDVTTKSPIRINIKSHGNDIILKWPGGGDRPLGLNGLDNRTYEQALSILHGQQSRPETGGVTNKELVIEAGRAGQPPLSILDLPGLVLNKNAPHREAIDRLVASFITPKSDGSHVLPILICKASDNYNNMRADLVKGRPFVAVLTHANFLLTHGHHDSDHIEHDMTKIKLLHETQRALERDGCKGMFLVSVPNSMDASEAWYESLCRAPQLTEEQQLDMQNMCGIPRLLTALQKLQFEHMLAHHSEMMAKLQSKLQEILPRVKVFSQPEEELQDEFCRRLQQIQKDVEESYHEGRKQLSDFQKIPEVLQLHLMVDRVLKAFSKKAFQHVLMCIKKEWATETSNNLANNTLMNDWRSEGWNMSAPTSDILGPDFAGKALLQLKDQLRQFILMRFEKRMPTWEGASGGFTKFLDLYIQDKLLMLNHEAEATREELHHFKLDTFAPFAYWLFMKHQDLAQKLAVPFLKENLDHQNSRVGELNGAFGPMQLDWYREIFGKEWKQEQMKCMVLAFFRITEIVERMSKRMVSVLFYRTFLLNNAAAQLNDTSLASLTLEQAFRQHRKKLGEGFQFKHWLDTGAGTMLKKKEVLQAAVKGLEAFSEQARYARSLEEETTVGPNDFESDNGAAFSLGSENLQPATPAHSHEASPAHSSHSGSFTNQQAGYATSRAPSPVQNEQTVYTHGSPFSDGSDGVSANQASAAQNHAYPAVQQFAPAQQYAAPLAPVPVPNGNAAHFGASQAQMPHGHALNAHVHHGGTPHDASPRPNNPWKRMLPSNKKN
ncbi:hypothetical protein WJX74_002331 [Apatococcus lobatus]|uniref:Dynamin N-terminal domain-containing protein n=2 Tax=Apatococcus TaxID=904362 RepID=A0AAW1SW85_9CHLO